MEGSFKRDVANLLRNHLSLCYSFCFFSSAHRVLTFQGGNMSQLRSIHPVLEDYRIRECDAFRQHCGQDNALVATRYSGYLILHDCGCGTIQPLLRNDNVDLKDWPKYGTYVQDYPVFREAARTAGYSIRSCRHQGSDCLR